MASFRSASLSEAQVEDKSLKRGIDAVEVEDLERTGGQHRRKVSRHASDLPTPESDTSEDVGCYQEALLLHAPKQKYAHVKRHSIPEVQDDREMLVKVQVVGLNPIDWKAPDFGFGLPALPCISGRDLAGKVVQAPHASSRISTGDTIMGISTDYRDSRKAAYQEYAIVPDYNACRLPPNVKPIDAAPLGVAFVAAALALGVCLGVDFSNARHGPSGPDLTNILSTLHPESLPIDVRGECFEGITGTDRPLPGDWIAIWGGSSATGCVAAQLAKLAGLKVIAILDVEKNGKRMLKHGADLLVDRLDTARAVAIVRGVTDGKLRFGLDTRDTQSATLLASTLSSDIGDVNRQGHLVGLTGLPKEATEGVKYHTVPIKAFHEAREVGEKLMVWLEKLLENGSLATPDIEVADGGLQGINDALDRLRDGSVSGPRIVVPLET